MKRRGFLRAALAVAAAAVASGLFGAGAAIDLNNQIPETAAGQLKRMPVIERYGWVDAYGLETIGYRKVWLGVDYSNGEGARARHR